MGVGGQRSSVWYAMAHGYYETNLNHWSRPCGKRGGFATSGPRVLGPPCGNASRKGNARAQNRLVRRAGLLEQPEEHEAGKRGITHADVIDLNREDIPGFDVREFYVQLVHGLKKRGL